MKVVKAYVLYSNEKLTFLTFACLCLSLRKCRNMLTDFSIDIRALKVDLWST